MALDAVTYALAKKYAEGLSLGFSSIEDMGNGVVRFKLTDSDDYVDVTVPTIKGDKGDPGDPGADGQPGQDGKDGLDGANASNFGFPTNLVKIKDYLYEAHYGDIDYKYAKDHYNEEGANFACSSVRKGNLYGRNFDWKYDNTEEFIVHTPRVANRYASVGVASQHISNQEDYILVPFKIVDGMNEKGVVCNINVVPNQLRNADNISAAIETKEILHPLMLVRYILDNFGTAAEACNYIRDYVDIPKSETLDAMGYDIHIMVADATGTYLLEFVDGETVVSNISSHPYMTNFLLQDVIFDDGYVTNPADGDPTEDNNITSLGSGLERYNEIVTSYDGLTSKEAMKTLMNNLKYTNAYDTTNPSFWYSEFVSEAKPLGTDVSEYDLERIAQLYSERSRDTGLTWQTVHSVIYDIASKTMSVIVQEDSEELEFALAPSISGGGSDISDAEDVEYTNTEHSDIDNVKEALDKLLGKVYYVNPSCSLSASPSGGTFEIGTVIEGVNFSWTVNKEIVSQTLTDCEIDLDDRSASYENNISSNKSFTLRVSDGTNAATSSVSYSFQPKVYYGAATVPESYDGEFCMGLTSSALKSSKSGTYALNIGVDKYGFIAMPKSFANVDVLVAKVGGFDTEIPKVATISLTNAKGHTQDYNIFKTTNSNLGSISAVVS